MSRRAAQSAPSGRCQTSRRQENGSVFLHVFNLRGAPDNALNLHGRQLHFTNLDIYDPPNPDLMLWHYKQCCLMALRTFSAGDDCPLDTGPE
jgi:hypothetical protein